MLHGIGLFSSVSFSVMGMKFYMCNKLKVLHEISSLQLLKDCLQEKLENNLDIFLV